MVTPGRVDALVLPDVSALVVGVLGGTGDQGRGLAWRLSRAGQPVLLGSRDAARAALAAAELGGGVRGLENTACAEQAELVVVAVPWEGHADLLVSLSDALAGKVVVDC